MKSQSCLIGGILVITDGSNNATCTVYDSADESYTGKKVVWKNTDAAANNYGGGFFVAPIYCDYGCYVVISGTGASFIIYEWKL